MSPYAGGNLRNPYKKRKKKRAAEDVAARQAYTTPGQPKPEKQQQTTPEERRARRLKIPEYKPPRFQKEDWQEQEPPHVVNLPALTKAYTMKYGKPPTAQQAFEMLSSTTDILTVKEWTGFLAPGLAEDPFTRKIMQGTFDFFMGSGKFPSAENMRLMMLANGKLDPMKMPIDRNDKTFVELLSKDADKVSEVRAKKPGYRFSQKDLERMPGSPKTQKEAMKLRQLANRPMYTLGKTWDAEDPEDRINDEDLKRINDVRAWYGMTAVKRKINQNIAQRAQIALQNPDGTDNVEAVRILARLTGQNKNDIRNPHTWVGLRDRAFMAENKDLNEELQHDLDTFGYAITGAFPQLKMPKSGHYVWDEKFDKWARTFLFYANIGSAVADNPFDKNKEKAKYEQREKETKIAVANLSIATNGQIKPDDDIRDWLENMGFLGDNKADFQDKLTDFLFEDCYLRVIAPKNQPMSVTIWEYVQQQGGSKESLPTKYRKYYDQIKADWMVQVAAQTASREDYLANPIGFVMDAQLDHLEYLQQMYQTKQGLPSPVDYNKGSLVSMETLEQETARRKPVGPQAAMPWLKDYELDAYVREMAESSLSQQLGGRRGPQIYDQKFDLLPMSGDLQKAAGLIATAGVGVLDEVEKWKNRIFLTLALMGEFGDGSMSGRMFNPVDAPIAMLQGAVADVTGSKYVKAGMATDPRNIHIPMGFDSYSWENIKRAWNEAANRSGKNGEQAYMKHEFEELGMNPKDNGTLLFFSDLAWSIGVDIAIDAGFGALAKTSVKTAARLSRSLMDPRILARAELAKKFISNEIISYEARRQQRIVDSLKQTIEDAQKSGDSFLANAAQRRKDELMRGEIPGNPFEVRTVKEADELKAIYRSEEYADSLLDQRPVWHDLFATAISKVRMTRAQMKMFLGIKDSHIPADEVVVVRRIARKTPGGHEIVEEKVVRHYAKEVDDICGRLCGEIDPEEARILLNYLETTYGIKINPGRLMLGKMRHLRRITQGDSMVQYTHAIPNGIRWDNAAEDAPDKTYTLGSVTNMGLEPGKEKEAHSQMWAIIQRYDDIDLTQPEELIDLQRQTIFKEFTTQIRKNMESRAVTEELLKSLLFWANRNGVKIPKKGIKEITNMWQAFKAFEVIKNHQQFRAFIGNSGSARKAWFDAVQSDQPFYLAGKKGRGQMAKDLVTPFNMQELSQFQRGKAGNIMMQYTNWGGRYGPSWIGATNAGRTLATASLSFVFSALFIDEFWRFGVMLSRGEVNWSHMRKVIAATRGDGLRRAASNATQDLIETSGYEFVPISPGTREYAQWFNKNIQMCTDDFIFEELKTFRQVLEAAGHNMDTMDPNEFKTLFRAHLIDNVIFVTGDDEAGLFAANLRRQLKSTKRIGQKKGEVMPEAQRKAIESERQAALDTADRQFDEARDIRKDLYRQLNELLDERITIQGRLPVTEEVPPSQAAIKSVFDEFTGPEYADEAVSSWYKEWTENPNDVTFEKLKDAILSKLTRDKEALEQELRNLNAQMEPRRVRYDDLDWTPPDEAARKEIDDAIALHERALVTVETTLRNPPPPDTKALDDKLLELHNKLQEAVMAKNATEGVENDFFGKYHVGDKPWSDEWQDKYFKQRFGTIAKQRNIAEKAGYGKGVVGLKAWQEEIYRDDFDDLLSAWMSEGGGRWKDDVLDLGVEDSGEHYIFAMKQNSSGEWELYTNNGIGTSPEHLLRGYAPNKDKEELQRRLTASLKKEYDIEDIASGPKAAGIDLNLPRIVEPVPITAWKRVKMADGIYYNDTGGIWAIENDGKYWHVTFREEGGHGLDLERHNGESFDTLHAAKHSLTDKDHIIYVYGDELGVTQDFTKLISDKEEELAKLRKSVPATKAKMPKEGEEVEHIFEPEGASLFSRSSDAHRNMVRAADNYYAEPTKENFDKAVEAIVKHHQASITKLEKQKNNAGVEQAISGLKSRIERAESLTYPYGKAAPVDAKTKQKIKALEDEIEELKKGAPAAPAAPEDYLYHGAGEGTAESIRANGLRSKGKNGIFFAEGTEDLATNPVGKMGDYGKSSIFGEGGYYRVRKSDISPDFKQTPYDYKFQGGPETSRAVRIYGKESIPPSAIEKWNPATGEWEPLVARRQTSATDPADIRKQIDEIEAQKAALKPAWSEEQIASIEKTRTFHKNKLKLEKDKRRKLQPSEPPEPEFKIESMPGIRNIRAARRQLSQVEGEIRQNTTRRSQINSELATLRRQDEARAFGKARNSDEWVAAHAQNKDRIESLQNELTDVNQTIAAKKVEKDTIEHSAAFVRARIKELDTKIRDEVMQATPPRPTTRTIPGTASRETTMRNALKVKKSPIPKSYLAKWLRDEDIPEDKWRPFFQQIDKDTLDEEDILNLYRHHIEDGTDAEANFARLQNDYQSETMAQRGMAEAEPGWETRVTEAFRKRNELLGKLKAARGRVNAARDARKSTYAEKPPKLMSLNKNGERWLDESMERALMYNTDPDIARAMDTGQRLSHKEIEEIRKRIKARFGEKADLPQQAGVKSKGAHWLLGGTPGNIPFISKMAELGPYRFLNGMGNLTRKMAFLGNYDVQYRQLIGRGFGHESAHKAATERALSYVDEVMYSPGATARESDLAGMFYFLPAYRQAVKYWGTLALQHPYLMARVRDEISMEKDQIPMQWWGDYGAYIPLPMFATQDMAETAIPGLTMPFLLPLRFFNTLSGWDKVQVSGENTDKPIDDEYKWVYTGNTNLDFMYENKWANLFTGFASKNVSPLSFIDDLMYGAIGDDEGWPFSGLSEQGMGGWIVQSLGIAMRKDPVARRTASSNIIMAQISEGMAPDTDVFEARLKGSPWWYRLLLGIHADNPEAILGAITREVFVRKISYAPNDIDVIAEPTPKEQNLWDQIGWFRDDDARTMGQAEWEYTQAAGDPEEQERILNKYPKLKTRHEFFLKNAEEREEYLSKEENQWLLPYVSGKYAYKDGYAITDAEYYEMTQRGALRRRENNEWMLRADRLHRNAHWTVKQAELDKRLKNQTRLAHKNAIKLIEKYAKTPQQALEWRETLRGYENGWWGETPPQESKDPYYYPAPWLQAIAYKEYGKDYLKVQHRWDAQAVRKSYDEDVTRWVEKPGTEWFTTTDDEKRERLQTIEDYYDDDTFKRWSREEGVGGAKRIADAFADILAPEDRKMFSINNSMSKNIIKEQLKKNKKYEQHAISKVLATPYYYLNSVEELAIALPGIMNPASPMYIGSREEFATWIYEAGNAYALKSAAALTHPSGSKKYYGDKYDAAVANYNKTMEKLFKSSKIGQFFKTGPAGQILHSFICQPEENKGPDYDYVKTVSNALNGSGKIDYNDLVDDYKAGSKYKNPERAESANAWASILSSAILLTKQVEKERKLDRGEIGDTRDRLRKKVYYLTQAWQRRSKRFRKEWMEYGGQDILDGLWEGS